MILDSESIRPAKPNQPVSATLSFAAKPGSVFVDHSHGGAGTYLVLGHVHSDLEAADILRSLPDAPFALSIRSEGKAERAYVVGVYNAPQALADLASRRNWHLDSTGARAEIAITAWACAGAMIRQENSAFLQDAELDRAGFAAGMIRHNDDWFEGLDKIWKMAHDPKTAGWFQPESDLVAAVQRKAADQIMVGGQVVFAEPDLCRVIAANPAFVVAGVLKSPEKMKVVAVEDPDRPNHRVRNTLAGWLEGDNGVRPCVVDNSPNPYALASEPLPNSSALKA